MYRIVVSSPTSNDACSVDLIALIKWLPVGDVKHFLNNCLNLFPLRMLLMKLNAILMYKILIFTHQRMHRVALITVIAVYQAVICVQSVFPVTVARYRTTVSTEEKDYRPASYVSASL